MTPSELVTGRLFAIQRFSTHDGSGIRTTVFFKGCPLRCIWCQNPEGILPERGPTWNQTLCIDCSICVECVQDDGIRKEHGRLSLQTDAAENWDELIRTCPSGALHWNSQVYTVDEIMAQIRRDLPFYRHGSGGVTLSGGEPLLQPEFALGILRACKTEGIHTALETALAAPWETLELLLPWLDQIFADCKLIDAEASRRFVGITPEPMLHNLSRLLSGGSSEKVTVRTPLVPGITATEQNIAAIAEFLATLDPDVPYELLNFNALAASKYEALGQSWAVETLLPLDESALIVLRNIARLHGLRNLIDE